MSKTTTSTRTPAVSAAIDGTRLTLTFASGQTLEMDAGDLTPDIREAALMHGLKQKLVDAAAISRNPGTGKSATPADKFEVVRVVFDRLAAGMWNAPREGGGNAGGILLRALVRHTGKPEDVLREWLAGQSDEAKAALRLNPRIAAHIAAIQAERAGAADIDTDALLGEVADLVDGV